MRTQRVDALIRLSHIANGGFFKAGNTLNQRYMRSDSTVMTTRIDVSGMQNGQHAGLAYFNGGKEYAFIGIEKKEQQLYLMYEQNGERQQTAYLHENEIIYLRGNSGINDLVTFEHSTDGKHFTPFGEQYLMKSGNFRGTMTGIFTYNDIAETGYIDIDWFDYKVANR